MSEKKIDAKITLNGEKEFKSGVTSCNKALSTMKSEMNLVKAQTAGQANTLESLKKKQEVLNKTLEAANNKEAAVSKVLTAVTSDYEKVNSELTNYKSKLSEAENKLKEMQSSGTATDEELKEQEKTVESLRRAVDEITPIYQKANDKVNDWQKQLNNAKTQVLAASDAVEENTRYMKEAETAADGCASSIDSYGKKVSDAAGETKELVEEVNKTATFQETIKSLEIVGETFKGIASSAYSAAQELDEGYDTIITKTGATGDALDDLNEVANNIFGELPTTMADVGIAVGEVNTRFALTGESLQELSEQFIEFAEINGTDLNNAVDTVDKLIKQFGLDTEDATNVLGIMTKRGQETGISMDTLMSSISSNSSTLKELGFSLEESINLLAQLEINGVDASATLRSLKTAVNNSTDSTLTAREALDNTITSIQNAESSTDALTTAQSVFGTKGAQVMVDAIRSGRINLDSLSDSLEEYSTTVTDTYNETLDPWDKLTVATNNLKTAGSDLAGEVLGTLEPALSGLVTVTQSTVKVVSGMPAPLKTTIGVIGALGVGFGTAIPKVATFKKALDTLGLTSKIQKGVKAVSAAIKGTATAAEAATVATEASNTAKEINTGLAETNAAAQAAETTAVVAETTATEAATVAQEGLNLAMDLCPVLLLAGGITTVVGVLAAFGSSAESSVDEVNTLASATNEAIDAMAESTEQLKESLNTTSESLADAEATGELADQLADQLATLASKTSLTTDEQAEMASCVTQLNSLYPDLGLEIDSTTGKLNKSNEEIKEQITNLKNLSMATAYQELYNDTLEDVTDNQKEMIKAQKQLNEVNEKLEKTQSDYQKALELSNKSMEEGNDGVIEWNGSLQSTDQVLMQIKSEQEGLEEQQRTLNGTIEENKEVVDAAKEEAQGYYSAYESLTESQNANTDATNANAEAQNAASEAHQYSINTAGEAAAAFNSLSEADQTAAVNVANSITELTGSVESALDSQMNMFEEFSAGSEATKEQILANMQSQVDGVTSWEENMNTLMTTTKTTADGTQVAIDEGLMQYLASLGPEGATYMQEFVNMSGDELAQANSLWEQSVDIKSMTNDLGQQLQDGIGSLSAGSSEAFAALGESLGVQASDTGGYIGQGLVEGLTLAKTEIETAGEESGSSAIDSLNEGAGVQSPSWKAKNTGMYVVQGLRNGISTNSFLATNAAGTLANGVINRISGTLPFSATRPYGLNVSQGLANGILAGQSLVISAATQVASAAISAAKTKLEINSPSHVFQRLGSGVIEGFVKGVDDNASEATDTIRSAMDFSDVKVNGGWGANSLTETIGDAIVMANSSGMNTLMNRLNDVYSVLQTYLPTAGNIYLDGEKVSKSITKRQNRASLVKNKLAGVM